MIIILPGIVVANNELNNNIFGIHLAVPTDEDLEAAADMVNSSGGDWGYITLVIQENDRDVNKWQGIFNKMRREHLIPIVRLATVPDGNSWKRASEENINDWLNFLNSLNWVVKRRYVILFNEPNHALEWGGAVDPIDYGKVAYKLASGLKSSNSDYFIMLAGLDQSAPQQPPNYMDEAVFLSSVLRESGQTVEEWEMVVDGLSSHSYPNPAFSGNPYSTGRGTILGYEWELNYLKSLGFEKELPVFITETGWKRGGLSESAVSDYIASAFNDIWKNDSRVKAVTPFILNYQSAPFLEFSYRKENSSEYYSQFYTTRDINKVNGDPEIISKFNLLNGLPKELVQSSKFNFIIDVINKGQSIWDSLDGYDFSVVSDANFKYRFSPLNGIIPGAFEKVSLYIQTPEKVGKHLLQIGLFKNGKLVSNLKEWHIKVIPYVDVNLEYSLLFSLKDNVNGFQAEVYDSVERLVYKRSNLEGISGQIQLKRVKNVAIGETYRVVLLKKGYLPRQQYLTVSKTGNLVKFERHLPVDWNGDGKLSLADLVWFLK